MVFLRYLVLFGALTPTNQPTLGVTKEEPLPTHALARFGTARWRMPDQIYELTWSADGKLLVACSTYRLIVFDAAAGKPLYEITPKRKGNPSPNDVLYALSGDSKVLAVGTLHWGHVELVDAQTGKPRGQLTVDNSEVNVAMALSPDGGYLAVCDWNDKLTVWETTTGHRGQDVKVGRAGFAFGADCKTLLVAGETQVRILEVASGKELRSLPGKGQTIALSADGRLLAVLGKEVIRLWDPETSRKWREINVPAKDVGSWARIFLSANGKTVAVEPQVMSGRMLAWDVGTGKELLNSAIKCSDYERTVALSPDGRTLAWGDNRTIRRWDLSAGKELHHESGHGDTVRSLSFLADGKSLASGGWYSELRLWNIAPLAGGESEPPSIKSTSCTFSANGRLVALYDWKGSSTIVQDLAKGKTVGKEIHFDGRGWGLCTSLAVSPDGRYLAASGYAATHNDNPWGAVWDLTTGKELHRWNNRFFFGQFSFAADGKHLIVRERDRLCWWDLATMKEVRSWRHDGWKCVEVFTPDGQILVVGNATIELKDVVTGKMMHHEAGGHSITGLAVSHDGKFLAAGDYQGVVRLYDLPCGYLRATFHGHSAFVAALAFSHDDKLLASGSGDTAVLLWDIAAALRHHAAAPMKPLTPKEMERLWGDLAGEDDDVAIQAVWTLVADKDRGLPFVKQRLQAIQKNCTPERIVALITQLDSSKYAEREEADRELRKIGTDALPALEDALRGKPSLEVRERVELLLARIRSELQNPTGQTLQIIRGVEILERSGTPVAQDTLKHFAAGPASRLQGQAEWVLDRLAAAR